ncbi:glycosyltransferase family 2 protein, partial [Schumannella luteola]
MNPGLASVSVVVPVYEGTRHLPEALGSVLAQTVPPLEVIVVDDGSTDGSASLVEAFAADHPQLAVRLIRQENRGQSASRNRAAAEAGGELIAFLDQDDRWYPDHLERLAAAFAKPDVGLAFSDFDEIDGDGHLVVRRFLRSAGIAHPRSSIVDWIASDTMILPSAAMVRASAFHGVGGFSEDLVGYEDDELWIRIFRAGWRSRYVDRPLGVFRIHAGSSSTRSSFRRSRVIFFRRVSAMLPDSVELRRYYTSDVLLPRLVTATLAD